MKVSVHETDKGRGLLSKALETLKMHDKKTLFKYQNLCSQIYYWYQLSLDSFSPFYELYAMHRDDAMTFMYGQEEAIQMYSLFRHCKEALKKGSIADNNLLKKADPKNVAWRNACRAAVKAAPYLTAAQKISIENDLKSIEEIIGHLSLKKTKKNPILYRSPQDFIKKLQQDANKPSMMETSDGLEIIVPENFAEEVETYVVVGADGCVNPALVKCNPHYKSSTVGKRGKVAYFFYGSTGETPYSLEIRKSFMGAAIFDPDTINLDFAFRGSRSGMIRAAESVKGEGNPDWATDLAFEGIHEAKICPKGKVCYGFAKAYLSVEKSLAAICIDAGKRTLKAPNVIESAAHVDSGNAPQASLKITTTGHSLGGAMATMFFLAMQEGTFTDTVNAILKAEPTDLPHVSKVAIKNQLNNACQSSKAITFSTPPTSDKEQITYLETRANVRRNFKRAFIEEDIITQKPSRLFLAFINLFKPKRSSKNFHILSKCKKIVPDHVRGKSISLGKYSNSKAPDVVVFRRSEGAPHAPDTNMKKIIDSLKGEALTPYTTYQYIDTDFEKFLQAGDQCFMPTAYASILAHSLDYERELTFIVAQVFEQPGIPKGMARRKVSTYFMDIQKVITAINEGIENSHLSEDASDAFLPAGRTMPPLAQLIPALIRLELKMKHTHDRGQYKILLRTFKHVSGLLREIAAQYPEVPNLQAISGHTRTFSSIYTKSPHCLIEFALNANTFTMDEKRYFTYYDRLKTLNKTYCLTQLCEEYEVLLEKYLAAKLPQDTVDVNPLLKGQKKCSARGAFTIARFDGERSVSKSAFERSDSLASLTEAMSDFATTVEQIQNNKLFIKIHEIVIGFNRQATRWNGMKAKGEQIERALNKLSLRNLSMLSYETLLQNRDYADLREALNVQRRIFKGSLTRSMSCLSSLWSNNRSSDISDLSSQPSGNTEQENSILTNANSAFPT